MNLGTNKGLSKEKKESQQRKIKGRFRELRRELKGFDVQETKE